MLLIDGEISPDKKLLDSDNISSEAEKISGFKGPLRRLFDNFLHKIIFYNLRSLGIPLNHSGSRPDN